VSDLPPGWTGGVVAVGDFPIDPRLADALRSRTRLLKPHVFPAPPFNENDWKRAGGDVRCETCGCVYYDHPLDPDALSFDDLPYLHVLCDGRRVKL
jgi:hypothetical protein